MRAYEQERFGAGKWTARSHHSSQSGVPGRGPSVFTFPYRGRTFGRGLIVPLMFVSFQWPRPFWIGIIRKISKSQLRSVSALRAKTVRKPHGLETTRARYSFLNFGSVPSCALFGLVLVFWHRFDGSWCYCGLLGFHVSSSRLTLLDCLRLSRCFVPNFN